MTEQLNRIRDCLSRYVQQPDGRVIPPTRDHIMDAIQVLIEDGYMTSDQIRFEALYYYDVIIPYNFFPKEGE